MGAIHHPEWGLPVIQGQEGTAVRGTQGPWPYGLIVTDKGIGDLLRTNEGYKGSVDTGL